MFAPGLIPTNGKRFGDGDFFETRTCAVNVSSLDAVKGCKLDQFESFLGSLLQVPRLVKDTYGHNVIRAAPRFSPPHRRDTGRPL